MARIRHPHLVLQRARARAGLSQSQFAGALGVAADSYRTWESGRRPPPAALVANAVTLTTAIDEPVLLPLFVLAAEHGVHVRTLRQAARDGLLKVSYSRESFFGRPKALATRAAMQTFLRVYYRQTTRWSTRPPRPRAVTVPDNYHSVLIGIRGRLKLTQAQLAAAVGAANKAVVYQWETRRRIPSAIFWKKVVALARHPFPAVDHRRLSDLRAPQERLRK